MTTGLIALLGIVCVIGLVTASVFEIARRVSGKQNLAIALGGLFLPLTVLIVGSIGVYFDQDVDGPPPGMVLGGLVFGSAALAPFTFLFSFVFEPFPALAQARERQLTTNPGHYSIVTLERVRHEARVGSEKRRSRLLGETPCHGTIA
jgi:protein-S-isoprenylcysteine O-methyltransferase Ste14